MNLIRTALAHLLRRETPAQIAHAERCWATATTRSQRKLDH